MQEPIQRTFTFVPTGAREYRPAPPEGELKIPRSVPDENAEGNRGGSFFARLVIALLLFGGVILAKNSASGAVQTFSRAVGASFSAEYALPENGIAAYLFHQTAFAPMEYPALVVPAGGKVVRSFGDTDENGSPCLGMILAADSAGPVYAAASGTVVRVDQSELLGNYAVVESPEGLRIIYGCCGEIFAEVGEAVTANTQIATLSLGGNGSYYLYFEVQQNDRALDPLKCFSQGGGA